MFDNDLQIKSSKQQVIRLQLAPLIDVFVLIIVFLLKGAVFTDGTLDVPANINPPRSVSKETTDMASQVLISKTEVNFKMINQTVSVDSFKNTQGVRESILEKLKVASKSNNTVNKQNLANVNIVADLGLKYEDLFEIVKTVREAGFSSMLFVAVGESQP
ncbi:hypothetical protein CIK05_11670 [Bdellovibrio sp. qaytius]|nr:hypothetical protein CIK05_11670 [Bdellovibrio sp. qaytius]